MIIIILHSNKKKTNSITKRSITIQPFRKKKKKWIETLSVEADAAISQINVQEQ
jgi:hypothetical protein